MIEILFLSLLYAFVEMGPDKTNLKAEKIAEFDAIVWGFDFINPNEIIVNLKEGEIKKYSLKTKKVLTNFKVPNLNDSGQGGLLDIKIHYSYPEKPYIYITYSKEQEGKQTTALARLELIDNEFKNFKVLYEAKPYYDETHHYGSRLVFDKKGYIFFSVGDRGNRDLAQSLETANGKIHRIKEDGSIPKDNPFYNKKGAIKSIWSYGHRNQQGLYYDHKKDQLWTQEHGPRGGDEINLVEKGANYGWPIITYGKEYWGPSIGEGTHKKGMKQPFYYYVPSIAPSGFLFYQGERYKEWQNHFLLGALKLQHLNAVDKATKKEKRYFSHLEERIRALQIDSDGYIYFSTDKGHIYKILKK